MLCYGSSKSLKKPNQKFTIFVRKLSQNELDPVHNLDSSAEYVENTAQELLKLYKEDKLFSIVPFQLAHSPINEDPSYASSKLQLQA